MDDLELTLTAIRPRLQPSAGATTRAMDAALRAHAQNFGRRTSRRRLHAAVALAAVAVLVAPAYALVAHVVDFSHSPKAPTVIQKRFQLLFKSGAPPGMDPRVIAQETRRAAVFELPSGSFPLWVAPTRTGGFCEEFVGLGGGCIADRGFPGITSAGAGVKPWLLSASIFSLRDLRRGIRGATYVSGVVLPKAASRLELRFGDGTTRPVMFIWVSSPIDAGFFLIELPATAVYPATLMLRDEAGDVLSESEPLAVPSRPHSQE